MLKSGMATVVSIAIILLLTSCAATYKQIKPPSVNYPSLDDRERFSYAYNVLKKAGNKKLAKKENKMRMNVVAIKITNTTGKPLMYGQNFRIYSGNNEATLLDPSTASTAIKQTAPAYLLYLLLTPLKLNIVTDTKSSSTPIGFVVGPALALGNVAVAATSNKNFKKEMESYSILDKEIRNGETFYGLIAIRDNGFIPLSLKLMP